MGFTGGVGFVIGLDAATRTTEAHARIATLTVVEMNNVSFRSFVGLFAAVAAAAAVKLSQFRITCV